MADLSSDLRQAVRDLDAARHRRDRLIVRASKAGMSRREVAAVTGMSSARVQQIVAERRSRPR
jgi:transposase